MALTTLWGETEATLLAALASARDDLKKGSALISTGSGDVNVAKVIQENARERIAEIQKALYELDPGVYADFATVGQNQTVARFS